MVNMKKTLSVLLTFVSIATGIIFEEEEDSFGSDFNKLLQEEIDKIPNLETGLAKYDIIQLITHYGYVVETHTVTTKDGYILTLHRIPNPVGKPMDKKKLPVLVMHGMAGNSACWVTNHKASLGFVLADQGYDVWMGNFRGTSFSNKHVNLSSSSSEYWDHCWHKMGIYDVPAMIDYILKKTGKPKLFHIGHSMGAGTFYVMTSTIPSYNRKIAAHFSMGPATYLGHTKDPLLKFFATQTDLLQKLRGLLGFTHFHFDGPLMKLAVKLLCNSNIHFKYLCLPTFLLMGGMHTKNVNASLLPLWIKYTPDTISAKILLHFLQVIKTGLFVEYDDNEDNPSGPHLPAPKPYKLEDVTCPVYILNGDADVYTTNEDTKMLYERIGSQTKEFLRVKDEYFTHIDHMWNMHAKELLYDRIIERMKKHN